MKCISDIRTLQSLIQAVNTALPRPHHHALLSAVSSLDVNCLFYHVLSKSGWYRAGGVIDANGQRLSHEFESWLNVELEKCGDDVAAFHDFYADAGLIVTRHVGRTHYFVAPYGPEPQDFLQLEVEELQEVLDRKLIDPELPAHDRTELVEPAAGAKVDAHPIGNPRYRFARIVDIRELIAEQKLSGYTETPLVRLLSDWMKSRSREYGYFCDHWLISNLEQYDPGTSSTFRAIPMSVHDRVLRPFPWDSDRHGVDLANQLRDFDRAAGYPGAWYFYMVASQIVPDNLASKLKRDLDNGYQYLAEKDRCLLEALVANPYHVACAS